MAAFVPWPPATRFSNCSASDLSIITDQFTCLLNVPTSSQAGPRCGNGKVEDNEACDCGEPGFCTNLCCNATTCQLTAGAQCAQGMCCNTTTCQILAGGPNFAIIPNIYCQPKIHNVNKEYVVSISKI